MVNMSTLEHLDCALPTSVAKGLRASGNELRMLPEAASKALAVIKEPNCSIGTFAKIVEGDVKLAADILRLANSPFYSVGRSIGDVREAVVQVGFRQCQNLIQASCASSLMQNMNCKEERVRNALWRHSLTTAMIAGELNRLLKLDFQGEEFTAGLMHDIGRLLLAVLFPDEFESFDSVDFSESDWMPSVETNVIATDHCALGCAFAVNNGLPNEIAEAIRFHHDLSRASTSPKLASLVAAADDLANFVARGDLEASYDVAGNVGLQALSQLSSSCDAAKLDEIANSILMVVLEHAA